MKLCNVILNRKFIYFQVVDLVTNEEREEVGMIDVYREFNTKVCSKFNIKQFKSRKVTKKYAFGKPGVPKECDYLEVCYSVSFAHYLHHDHHFTSCIQCVVKVMSVHRRLKHHTQKTENNCLECGG